MAMHLRSVAGALALAAVLTADAPAQTPRYRPPVAASQWQLGVAVKNRPGGVQITRVARGSVARQAGLEVGDTILAVSGAPVGYVHGRLHDLEDEPGSGHGSPLPSGGSRGGRGRHCCPRNGVVLGGGHRRDLSFSWRRSKAILTAPRRPALAAWATASS